MREPRNVHELTGPVVGVSEAARLLGTSVTWLRKLVARGTIEAWSTPIGMLVDVGSIEAERERRCPEKSS